MGQTLKEITKWNGGFLIVDILKRKESKMTGTVYSKVRIQKDPDTLKSQVLTHVTN